MSMSTVAPSESPTAMPVIDVDSHWTEPRDLWTSRAPARLRDRALRVERNAAGADQWVIEDGQVMGQVGYCSIRPDGSKSQGSIAFDRFDEVHPGAMEVAPRLAYMDEHGLAVQIVYPNLLGFAGNLVMRVQDEAHRAFCATAYNDAASDMQRESRGRLYPQAMLPFWDIPASLRELERCQDELGLTGIVITDCTDDWGLPPLGDRHWDPLWDALQSRGMPVNFHIGAGSGSIRLWGPYPKARAFAALSTMAQMGNLVTITNLIFSGLLDRFPSLKFVSVESGVGWLPFLIESLEYQYEENGVDDLKLRPRAYFSDRSTAPTGSRRTRATRSKRSAKTTSCSRRTSPMRLVSIPRCRARFAPVSRGSIRGCSESSSTRRPPASTSSRRRRSPPSDRVEIENSAKGTGVSS